MNRTFLFTDHLSPRGGRWASPLLPFMLLVASLLTTASASAQNITTVAGGGQPQDGPPLSVSLGDARRIAVDLAGNVYIPSPLFHRVFKFDAATNTIMTVAGNGVAGFGGDGGAATSANLNVPGGVAVDGAGNIFISDQFNHRIRRVDAMTGVITTVAGNGNTFCPYNQCGDGGAATDASLSNPQGVAADSIGNIFVADGQHYRIRRVDAASGIITTVAGNGRSGYSGDGGAATSAQISLVEHIAVDGAGRLLISDTFSNRVRRVDANGIITTVAGDGTDVGQSVNGVPATATIVYRPAGVTVDGAGNIFVADLRSTIRRVDAATGIISTVAGSFPGSTQENVPATNARLNVPTSIAFDGVGNLFVMEGQGRRVRRIDAATNLIATIAGNGYASFGGDGGAATAALLGRFGLSTAVDGAGNVIIADASNNRIRRVDAATGVITTIAGTGQTGFNGDNIAATSANLSPFGVAVDLAGNILIADSSSTRIRRLDAVTGIITTVAGNGQSGYNGDNIPATSARLSQPRRVAVDGAGRILVSEPARVRRIDSSGIITTIAGTGTAGYNGDGIAATTAQLNNPSGLTTDAAGNIFIADAGNNRIRKIDASTGVITTVAGNGQSFGTCNYNGVTALSMGLPSPSGVAVDGAGNLFVANLSGVWRVATATGTVTEVTLHCGTFGYNGDDIPATSAVVNPSNVALNDAGDLFIGDDRSGRVRLVRGIGVPRATDSTPPVITPTVTGTLGNNGWYTSDVSISWNVADAESTASPSGCDTSTITADTGGVTFTCTATSAGGTTSRSVTIKRDATAPTLANLSNATAEGTSPAGAVVSYNVTAADALDPLPALSCTPPSGSTFPLGVTTITCTATDAAGNNASGNLTITVVDTTPPAVTASLTAVGHLSRTMGTFSVGFSATDVCDVSPAVRAVMSIPAGAEGFRVVFDDDGGIDGGDEKIIFDYKTQRITLAGGDRIALQNLLAGILVRGGVPVASGQQLRLHLQPAGDGNQQDGSRRFEFTFRGGVLVGEKAATLTLLVTGADRAGNSATAAATPVFAAP